MKNIPISKVNNKELPCSAAAQFQIIQIFSRRITGVVCKGPVNCVVEWNETCYHSMMIEILLLASSGDGMWQILYSTPLSF